MVIDLSGKVCLVTGGSHGVGRGIALELVYHGAKCYVTGRNLNTLEHLNKEVKERGAVGELISVKCDHSVDNEAEAVFERIRNENDGKLDLLVNNVYSAVQFIMDNIKKTFWEEPRETWDNTNNVGLRNHYLCAMQAAKMMVERRQGLIINMSSIGGARYALSSAYGVGKAAKDRMAADCGHELRKYKVAFISLWPGIVKTEKIVDSVEHGVLKSRFGGYLIDSAETMNYVGRTVAALLSETQQRLMQRSGQVVLTTDIGREYGIVDEYGFSPPCMRQLNHILRTGPYAWLSNFIPDFVRLPLWVIRMRGMFSS